MTLRLTTFGGVYLTRDGTVLTGAAGQRRLLALLTVVASTGERGMSRDKVLALLWSEGEPDKSRHALTQALYHTRKALGTEQIFLNGTDLRANPDVLSSDLADLQRAIDSGRLEDAAAIYAGPFLDGFYLNGDPGFDFWVSSERDRLARQHGEILSTLASRAAAAGDLAAERRWRERLVEHDPLISGSVVRLMTCLVAAGDSASALQVARSYEARIRAELDLPPDRAVTDLVGEIRRDLATGESVVPAAEIVEASEPAVAEQIVTAQTVVSAKLVAAPAAEPVVVPAATPLRQQHRQYNRWWLAAASLAAASVAVVVGARVAGSRYAADEARLERSTIMVAPFRVEDGNPSTAYLSEGLLDLLTTRIADADTKRAADPSRVLEAWKTSGYPNDSVISVNAVSRIARDVGASEVLIGSVSASASGVSVHASLIDAARSTVKAQADVRGSADSLIALADQVISTLILKEFGEHVGNGLKPVAISHLALRAYLSGRVSYRRGDYYGAIRSYSRAMVEEPNFALAALELAMAADHVNVAEQHDRGLAVAWAQQSDLSPADRAYLRAFAGPRYPEASSAAEALAAWETVVRVAPDRAEGWHQLGESFYNDGEALGMRDGLVRAEKAFRRALELDPSFAPSRRMLTMLLARQKDTAGLRALLAKGGSADTSDVNRVFLQWRVARTLGDWREVDRLRRAFDDAPNSALRSIAMTSQFDGVAIEDGDHALEILRHRPLTEAEEIDVSLARHARALQTGDYGLALAITNELGSHAPGLHPQLRLRVLDALYSSGDRTAALAAATDLERKLATKPVTTADTAVRLADLCVIGQWRLSLPDTAGARETVHALRGEGTLRFPVPVGATPGTCAELIDVALAVSERGQGARDRLNHLDSLMLSGPAVGDAVRYANMVIAKQYQALGDPARALSTLLRRSGYMRGWPRYRATGLQLQTQLALQTGDTATARLAYQRFLATRTPPVIADRSNAFVHRLRAFSRRLVQ